jgi:Tfp pilus assembly protein PilV
MRIYCGTLNKQEGMTLLEVLVGFVIFTASLVAILNYVSNQVYLNHQTEKNLQKALLIYDYSLLSATDPEAGAIFAASQPDFNLKLDSTPVDSYKDKNSETVLVKTQVSVGDGAGNYDWSILELR